MCDAFIQIIIQIFVYRLKYLSCHCSTEVRVVFPRAPWQDVSQVEPSD